MQAWSNGKVFKLLDELKKSIKKDEKLLENTPEEDLPLLINHKWISLEAKKQYHDKLAGRSSEGI